MTGPWYITPSAVRNYLAIRGWPENTATFDRAQNNLIVIAMEIVASGKPGKADDEGFVRYRTGRARGRMGLVVSTVPTEEGELPQLVAVTRSKF